MNKINLDKLIKTDEESQKLFSSFKKEAKKQENESHRRARVTSFIIGFATIASISFLLYAFKVQNSSSKEIKSLEFRIQELQTELKNCQG